MKVHLRDNLYAGGRNGRPLRRVLVLLNWYMTGLHRGIARYAHEAGWALDVVSGHLTSPLRPPLSIWRPDGIIGSPEADDLVHTLTRRGAIPTVKINCFMLKDALCVASDNDLIGEMAADYFQRRGFTHMAYYTRETGEGPRLRSEAFRRAVEKRGGRLCTIDMSVALPKGPAVEFAFFDSLRKKLAELPKPLAVLAHTDDEGVEVITAAQAEGLGVPQDVAVLGVGNDELRCEFAPVRLSSVDDNLTGTGYTAAQLLNSVMQGRSRRAGIRSLCTPPVGVVTRDSTDITAIRHPHVHAALAAIQAHFREPVNAQTVVKGIPLSYRRLHEAFQQHVGHSISAEITRLRVEHAARLLTDTDDKLELIARTSGFSSEVVMSRVFRSKKHMPPGAFRRAGRNPSLFYSN